jgi:hypothetical protein
MGKKTSSFSPLLLVVVATVLLAAGWLMGPLPILIFLGMAPLFTLADKSEAGGAIFEKMELVLLALGVSFVLYAFLRDASVVIALVSAITFTLAFVAHAWVRQTLGIRTGKITLILFWLALEYLMLKLIPEKAMFLADTLSLQGEWLRWTIHTGYLGASLWVLLVNWCWYETFLHDKAIHWGWFMVALVLWAGPAVYSYTMTVYPITRQDMINLYGELPAEADVTYLARGELTVRTAAWISTLILLFTLVKHQTKKR